MPDERAALEDFVLRFTAAFNRDDLDGVMALMAPHAVYDEFNGALRKEWRGLDILHVEDGLVTEKHTYAKAEVPLLRDPK